MLAALAFKHSHRAATEGIQHRPDQRGLLTAMVAGRDRVGVVAGKDFVLELVTLKAGLAVEDES